MYGNWGDVPQWDSTGTRFITNAPPISMNASGETFKNSEENPPYVGRRELFLVSQDGTTKRLTYLTLSDKANQLGYSWSNAEDNIAFWLYLKSNEPTIQLSILDMNTLSITSLCFSPQLNGSSLLPPIAWSPDDQALLVTTNANDSQTELIIIDLRDKKIFDVSDNAIGLGWLR
jgi:Tol biopolymer transport system component